MNERLKINMRRFSGIHLPDLLKRQWRRFRPGRPTLLVVGALLGFVLILSTQLRPPDPESRLPGPYRLAALINRQEAENEQQREEVEKLRREIENERSGAKTQQAGASVLNEKLSKASVEAGSVPMKGLGFTVTLNDSTLSSSPTGNVNDLVIHSQDVQAVVNAMWQAGAEAISINGQRVVSTSAVLCVGSTLLINGTVHSPPYEVSAIGAKKSIFNEDPLIKRLRIDAERFSLKFSASGESTIEVPGYSGPRVPRYAQSVNLGTKVEAE